MALGRKTGGGSRKGLPNKATKDARAAMALLLDANLPKLQAWLDSIAEKDPAKAFDMTLRLAEFCIPKLARSEVVGDDGPLTIRFVDPTRRDSQGRTVPWPLPRTALDDPPTAEPADSGKVVF